MVLLDLILVKNKHQNRIQRKHYFKYLVFSYYVLVVYFHVTFYSKLSRSFLNLSPSPADSGHGDEFDETKKLRQAYDELREKHNDKIEELLKSLGELNEK